MTKVFIVLKQVWVTFTNFNTTCAIRFCKKQYIFREQLKKKILSMLMY